VGHRAEEHNNNFAEEKSKIVSRFTIEIGNKFFHSSTGEVDWMKLTQFNSGNYISEQELT
jgi:hypothetical protein